MLTITQIYAVLALLSAFNVPADTVSRVEVILLNSAQSSHIQPIQGVGAPSEVTRVTSPPVTQTPSVVLKVNGSDSPVTVTPNGCIVNFVKTCASIELQWTSVGVIACGVTASPGYLGWAGGVDRNGSKTGTISTSTTATIECTTGDGKVTDSVDVILK